MDELDRRMHLEALGIGYSFATLLLTTLAMMQRGVSVSLQDWSYAHVWIFLLIFDVPALGCVSRRYQAE